MPSPLAAPRALQNPGRVLRDAVPRLAQVAVFEGVRFWDWVPPVRPLGVSIRIWVDWASRLCGLGPLRLGDWAS